MMMAELCLLSAILSNILFTQMKKRVCVCVCVAVYAFLYASAHMCTWKSLPPSEICTLYPEHF